MKKSRIAVSALAALGAVVFVSILAYVILAVVQGMRTYRPADSTGEGTVSLPGLQSSAVVIMYPVLAIRHTFIITWFLPWLL